MNSAATFSWLAFSSGLPQKPHVTVTGRHSPPGPQSRQPQLPLVRRLRQRRALGPQSRRRSWGLPCRRTRPAA